MLGRVRDVPPIRFFTVEEARTLQALVDTVIPQDDRPPELRVPVLHYLDRRLHEGSSKGYRYERLPPDPEFWRTVARAFDNEARLAHGRSFADLTRAEREDVVRRAEREDVRSAEWRRIPLDLSFALIVGDLASHYYSHPYAWNEVGWAGPRFPRVYPRTARDNPDEPQEATRER